MVEPPLPTDAELAILNVLWQQGPSTVREVFSQVERSRPVAYTTVLKMLQLMHQKGLVTRNEEQRNHVYTAVLPRDATQERLIDDLTSKAFGGSATRLMMRALEATPASVEERERIRALLAELDADEEG